MFMSEIHRTIKAILYPNLLKNAKGKYLARTSKNTTYNIREICESLKEKSGVVNIDALEYHAKLFFEEMLELLEDGNKINTGYFTVQANVKGSFDSFSDNFDENKHSVDIVFSAGHLTRQRVKSMKAEILHVKPFSYGIRKVTDMQTKLETNKLVVNRILVISGDKIRITGDNPTVGLYLIHTENGKETHFPATALYQNSNATLTLIVPELVAGTYQLKVTTQYAGKGTPLTKPRSFTYPNLFQVD